MKIYKLLATLAVACTMTSCNDWLDVEPNTEMDRNALFQNEAGFADAMSGVYVNMISDELYGKTLTWHMLEIIGGGARVMTGENANLMGFSFHPDGEYYTDTYRNTYVDPIWNKAYNTIANLNSILECIDDKESVFQDNDYSVFKGEALGLRAFIHFDLLRLFSDAYASGNYDANKTYIPYVASMTSKVYPLLTVDQCCKFILDDLNAAKNLLVYDPIYTDTTPSLYLCDEVSGKVSNRNKYGIKDWHNRRFHFNYYACVATMARVYSWMGNKEKALECALEVINAPEGTFTWVAPELVSNISSTSDNVARDRTFSTEQIFALNITDMQDRMDGYMYEGEKSFDTNGNIIGFNADCFDETTRQYDIRYAYLKSVVQVSGSEYNVSVKYYEDKDNGNTNSPWSADRLPLIRLSEMYYIAAECENDLGKAKEYLETVRRNRGLSSYPLTCNSKSELQNQIELEYEREFIAEGQLFYYHKRLNQSYVNRSKYNEYQIEPKVFTFPRPDDEDVYGGHE